MMTLEEYFDKGITYDDYMTAFEHAVASKRTSGPIQTEELAHYTELNLTRSKRIIKHTELDSRFVTVLNNVSSKIRVICITEFWCGDAAHINPVLALISKHSNNIQIKYLFRDENLELMDQYLTNNGRSIPIYILIDEHGAEIDHWGPRPSPAQHLLMELKAADKSYEEIKETVIKWYNTDKSKSIQEEWTTLLSK